MFHGVKDKQRIGYTSDFQKRFRRLKHYLLPHAGNRYKPGLFLKESVAALALALFLIEGVYFFQTRVVIQRTGFLAAVLPAALTDLTNNDRALSGTTVLVEDPLLAKAAEMKAEDMAAKGYFAHVSPEGKTPWYWLDSVGYEYSYAGENLAVNFTDSVDVETAWMNSPEHRANIMKPEYTRIGIGTAKGIYNGEATTFVVQLFATPAFAAPKLARAEAGPEINSSDIKPADGNIVRAPDSNGVLGVQVERAPVGALNNTSKIEPLASGRNFLAMLASSPNRVVTWILGAFAGFITLLLALAILVKRKAQHLEVVLGGTVLISLALTLVFFNGGNISNAELPHDGQSASVSMAL